MIWVYALRSELDGMLYVGIAKDTAVRLEEHNRGKSKFTKGHLPWVLVYREMTQDWPAARKREKYLKSGVGKEWLKATLQDPDFRLV